MRTPIAVQDERGRSVGQVDPDTGYLLTDDGREIRPDPVDETQMMLAERAAMNADRRLMTDYAATGDRRLMAQTVGDVRVEAPMTNFMQGYALVDGIADVICPVIATDAPSKQYWEWNSADAFQRPGNVETAPGAQVREISPRLSKKRFDTIERALASAVPTEVINNAQAPIDPLAAAVRRVQNAMRLEREIRVAQLLTTAGNWDSSLVTTLSGTTKWNGGTSSDPVADLVKLIQASWAPVTRIVMGEQAGFAFSTNPNVQKYIAYKNGAAPIPASQQITALFTLPPITIVNQKYSTGGSGLTYTWGGDVVLVHEPDTRPPDGQDIMTCATFRWDGGATPDGAMVDGWLVRTYFDNKRGPKGSTVVVVVNQDGEVMTSKLAGGLIKGAFPVSKYHVIHGSVVVGTGKGDDAERKTFEVGDSFELPDADAKPLLEAGTIGKGAKLKDGEEPPVTNTLVTDDGGDVGNTDEARTAAADGAPEGSQNPKAAAKDFRAQAAAQKKP